MNIYDFDNTIYDGDSTADFYFFCLKRHKKIIALFPSLLFSFIKFYIFKIGTKTQFKEKMYRFLNFCNTEKDVFDFWSVNKTKIKGFYLNQQRDDDIIISASPEFLIKPICKELGIKYVIASKVNSKTGKYSGINCHGEEKVRRLNECLGNVQIEKFYSDSISDAPLANLAKEAYVVNKNKIYEWNFNK